MNRLLLPILLLGTGFIQHPLWAQEPDPNVYRPLHNSKLELILKRMDSMTRRTDSLKPGDDHAKFLFPRASGTVFYSGSATPIPLEFDFAFPVRKVVGGDAERILHGIDDGMHIDALETQSRRLRIYLLKWP